MKLKYLQNHKQVKKTKLCYKRKYRQEKKLKKEDKTRTQIEHITGKIQKKTEAQTRTKYTRRKTKLKNTFAKIETSF